MFEHRFVKFVGGNKPGYELWLVELVNNSYKLIHQEGTEQFDVIAPVVTILNKGVLAFELRGGEWVYIKTVDR